MTALIATDLDRTMIYSRSAIGEGPGAEPELVCVEMYDGSPLSHMSVRGAEQLRTLAITAVVVPTTTRTIAQFQRIDLPGVPFRYAITSNGGNILVDGAADPQWREQVDAAVLATGTSLESVTAELHSRIDDAWVLSSRVADGLFHYLVVDLALLPATFLAQWDRWCRDRGWNASQQGRKIYTMPDAVSKGRAVTEVRRRLVADGTIPADSQLLAAGDGALDADMLIAADTAIRPRHGELESLNWQHPTVTVTTAAGIAAGEEILDWFTMHTAAESRDVPAAT
jgi:hypothetical protein